MVLSCLITVLIILRLNHLDAVQLKEVSLGDTVVLKCNISFYNDIHWLKMSEGRPMALMVTSLKHNGELSVVWNYNESRFEGFMEEQMTVLRIFQISTSDLSTYHCATLYQKHLDFDKGVQLYTNQQRKEKPFDSVKDLSEDLETGQFKSQTRMPFCHVPGMNPSGTHGYCLLLLFALVGILCEEAPDAVKVRDTAIIPCNKTCNGKLLWVLKTKNENLDVLKCEQGTCTEGDGFKNRVSIFENSGNPSLKLYPVLYNDEGWYMVYCDSKFLCKFHLEVFVPTTVNATIRNNVTLPCYARTEKRIADDAVNVLWKKDDQTVLQVQKGIPKHGSSFTGRASVSLHHYKDGDLSLTISSVTMADKGLYRCYHNTEEEHGHPGAVTLNVIAHQKVCAKKFGDNLTLDLFGSDPATVTFTGSTETWVCNVSGNHAECSPEYTNRVSVVNNSLVLGMLTTSDRGTFTVKDKMGEVISINTVTVEGVTQRHHYVALAAQRACIHWIFTTRNKPKYSRGV
ncbi:si:dkey-22i16.9 [Pimephales promelas]|nr:si:dkey-22i16.9 [Pimephales promelas]